MGQPGGADRITSMQVVYDESRCRRPAKEAGGCHLLGLLARMEPVICKIANGAGFWGDNVDAPRRLVEAAEVDYLTLEYLAELTLSILARIREKDPTEGYPHDFLTVLKSLLPALNAQPNLRIVTNAGGMNPQACAAAAGHILARAGLPRLSVGVVSGDDIVGRLDELAKGRLSLGKPGNRRTPFGIAAPRRQRERLLGSATDRRGACRRRADRDHRPRGRRLADARPGRA